MKSKFLLSILNVLILTNISAQVNFFQTGARWGYFTVEHPDVIFQDYRTWLRQYEITGDTIVNNISYKTLYSDVKLTGVNGGGGIDYVNYSRYGPDLLRFDSLVNKVFCIYLGTSAEKTIYDFDLVVGDTMPNPYGTGLIIDSIEQITFFGSAVKKFYISDGFYYSPDHYIIEGMGCANGLTEFHFQAIMVSAHLVTNLICFQLGNDIYPPGSPACDVFAGVQDPVYTIPLVSVYPNPFHEKINFKLKITHEETQLRIFDGIGKVVYASVLSNELSINLKRSGIFFWEVSDNGEVIDSGKIIKK